MADEGKKLSFDRSLALTERLHRLIPGGAHTYAKGDDQYPVDTPPILVRGEGARVWDVDGNELLGLRAVSLGHSFAAVNEAAARQMYTPGMRIPIRHPERITETRPDYLVILPWNLEDEIMAQMAHIRQWGGRFVVPIPGLQVFD